MMVLYSGTTCPFSHRCRFVLFEKGMDFEIRDVDLYNKPEDINVMNPYGQVPILVDWNSPVSSKLLLEASAIHRYERWGAYHNVKDPYATPENAVSIIDNGPGFAPRILSRAFEPYVTSKARGTGLGLPMVKKIVDEHGGRIDVANRADGSGASVSILLLKLAPEANLAEA